MGSARFPVDFDTSATSSRTGFDMICHVFDMVFGLAAELLSEQCFPRSESHSHIQNHSKTIFKSITISKTTKALNHTNTVK